ncbi:MAG TPA: chromate transporter [Streptosporangiaceae bacterium]|nr:chromate transporter [Streptosporangiaceae bacterium]
MSREPGGDSDPAQGAVAARGTGPDAGRGEGPDAGRGEGQDAGRGTGPVALRTIVREWGRIGCIGFGGPPAHIALLRKLCVEQRGWLSADEFEDGIAATNLLPGPASTQLAIFCAWRLAGPAGALIGGACFILPGLVVILALAVLFLAAHPPLWVAGAAAGAGAAVPAVAAAAAAGLMPASWRRAAVVPAASGGAPTPGAAGGAGRAPAPGAAGGAGAAAATGRLDWRHVRWLVYLLAGGVVGALAGPFLVLMLAACGLAELAVRAWRSASGAGVGGSRAGSARSGGSGSGGSGSGGSGSGGRIGALLPLTLAAPAAAGGLLALAWVALKVGALSYGGGFVIVPLMQHDAVRTYHWMTGAQFLSAVALGQVTPGPVVQTVAVVGFAAAGVAGGVLAALIAFAPSFAFVLAGASRFAALRRNARVQAFLTGAGPAAIGAIAGSTIPLALALAHLWQLAVLGLAVIWLLALRRSVVTAIVGAAGLGMVAVLAGAPLA